jgi:molybdopterin converting factor subunit 1
VRISVRLFARLREIAGGELLREVPSGADVAAVWRDLALEFPDLAPYGRTISAAVNGEYTRMDRAVQDNDEVAFLPPVSGG